MVLALLLGRLAFRQVRRAARFEAEAEQQARVRLLERQLAHSERLASVGRLAAGFAHEINNPLAGMLNHLALLQDDLAQGDQDAAGRQAKRVREGLDRVAGIVRRVLTFAGPRPAAGEGGLETLDLRQVVDDTIAFVSTDPDHREVEIERRFPAQPVEVRGDPVALGQLVLNLLLNACQSERCGHIEVWLRSVEGSAVMTVSDDGDGFEEDALEHIFEPFFSTRGTSGLGLAVCHGLVREHGGEIRAQNRISAEESDPKSRAGAVVEVRLPLATAPATAEAAEVAP
jgi:signal transduction histidine kinase